MALTGPPPGWTGWTGRTRPSWIVWPRRGGSGSGSGSEKEMWVLRRRAGAQLSGGQGRWTVDGGQWTVDGPIEGLRSPPPRRKGRDSLHTDRPTAICTVFPSSYSRAHTDLHRYTLFLPGRYECISILLDRRSIYIDVRCSAWRTAPPWQTGNKSSRRTTYPTLEYIHTYIAGCDC